MLIREREILVKTILKATLLAVLGSVSAAAEISPGVQARLSLDTTSRVIITLKDKISRSRLDGKDRAETQRMLKASFKAASRDLLTSLSSTRNSGVKVVSKLWAANAIVADLDQDTLKEVVQNDAVEYVSEDRVIDLWIPEKGNDVERGKWTYGLKNLGVDKVRSAYGLTGKGVVVGILDSGIDGDHPDFKGKILKWKDFAGDASEPVDKVEHGTHCAGTIAGGDASGTQIGVAPDAKLIVGRIFGDTGSASLSGIIDAMNWIADPDGNPDTDDAPRLISNSWGGRKSSFENEKAMWNIVKTWRALNIVPVYAAGNSGPWAKTVGTPGGYPHSFAVAAVDKNDKAAYFSSRGPIEWNDKEYIKPDIAAPGVDIYSAKPGGGYQTMDGTSMACPHVSGLIALMLQANPNLTVDKIENLLTSTAIDLGDKGKDNTYGYGRADIMAVIDKIKSKNSAKQKETFESMFE
jgi:subtilisin family serine protease